MKWKGRGRKPLWYLSGEAEENHGNNLFHEREAGELTFTTFIVDGSPRGRDKSGSITNKPRAGWPENRV
jgi:hypothetical protein